ncbi:hypothetical protein JMUB6875_43070 [Nocardia sp. JMUB6875]|uniref:hypothetical protein n=1 Tax=Nocardia sp. JMUB6875 TaxID=3158170 RepID=UPI0032E6CD9D
METLCLLLILATLYLAVTRRSRNVLILMTGFATALMLVTLFMHSDSTLPISV